MASYFVADRGAFATVAYAEVDNYQEDWGAWMSFSGTAGHQYRLGMKLQVYASVYTVPPFGAGTAIADVAPDSWGDSDNYFGHQGMTLSDIWFYVPAGCCLAPGTDITMADGSTMPIEDIKKGMSVLGYDVASGSFVPEEVISTSHTKSPVLINFNDGLLLATPYAHPLYVFNGVAATWVRDPADVQVGWQVFSPLENEWTTIASKTPIKGDFKVYDITLTDPLTYIANGVLCEDKKK